MNLLKRDIDKLESVKESTVTLTYEELETLRIELLNTLAIVQNVQFKKKNK